MIVIIYPHAVTSPRPDDEQNLLWPDLLGTQPVVDRGLRSKNGINTQINKETMEKDRGGGEVTKQCTLSISYKGQSDFQLV